MRVALGAAALLAVARIAPAQTPEPPSLGPTWTDVMYPKLFWTPRDGLTVGGYYALIAPLGFADFDRPPAYRVAFTLNGQISTSGSRELLLEARMPDLFRGWRVVATLNAQRRARENYFGIGNTASHDPANVTPAQEHFYRSLNVRLMARGEIQRQVIGPLRVLAGVHAERWRVDTLPGPSQLRLDLLAGRDPTITRPTNEVAFRAGLVFDARDSEPAPRRGALIEAIHSVADPDVAGDLQYQRTTVSAAAYLSVIPQLVLAARVAGERMTGTPRLGSYYVMEASDRPFVALGGAASHRALYQNRFLGRSKLLANFDVRYDVFAVPTLAYLTVVGFVDAGRVFETEVFEVTTRDLKVGGGAGLFLQFGRAGILGTTVGKGPDGITVQAHTKWSF